MSVSTPNSTAALVEHAAQVYGDRVFIVDGAHSFSFTDVATRVRALASALAARDFQCGNRAAIWAPNCAEWIIAALAIQYVGGTLVTVNTRYKATEASQIIRDSGSSVAFVVDHFLGNDYADNLAAQNIEGLHHIVTIRAPGSASTDDIQTWVSEGAVATPEICARRDALRRRVNEDTVSDILFTSGTTGRAKGVVTTHGQNLRAFSTFASILGIESDDRYLIINPFFHSFGYKAGWLAALLRGATVYPMATFDVPQVLNAIKAHAITVMPGPPTLFQSILMHADLAHSDLSSLKKATTGAAIIPTQLIIDMRETLGIDTVITAYGLSETCGLVTMCRQGDPAEVIAQTSGRAIPDVEVSIMRSDGTLAAPHEAGEIVVRGFNVMQCYFNDERATRETIDPEGWLHTGDIGTLDESGNIRITDRLKDMFISGGFNCYPAEIENQLLHHGAIAQAAVVGMSDERMGEVGAAFVVNTPGTSISEDALITWCRDTMANYKVPRKIIFLDALPMNASGKVLKTVLRQRL